MLFRQRPVFLEGKLLLTEMHEFSLQLSVPFQKGGREFFCQGRVDRL